MNLPKLIFSLTLVVYLFLNNLGFSQKDSSAKWLRFSIDAAFITNAANSHYEEPSDHGRYYSEKISKNSNSMGYLPGFSLGVTSVWGKSKIGNFIFGISTSVTNSNYHYSSSRNSEGSGYSGTSVTTEKNIISTFIYLNYEAGFRFRLTKKFSLQPSFLLNQNLQTLQKENGTTSDVSFAGANYPSGFVYTYYNRTDNVIHSKKSFHGQSRSSVRVSAFYNFKLGQHDYTVFAFRNFGIKQKLPWWGLGISLTF